MVENRRFEIPQIFGTGLAAAGWPGSWLTFANTLSGGHLRTREMGWVEEGRRDLAQPWKKKQGRKRNFKPADFIQYDSAADTQSWGRFRRLSLPATSSFGATFPSSGVESRTTDWLPWGKPVRKPFWARGQVPRSKNGFLRCAGPPPQTGAALRKGVHLKREICMVCLSLCNRPRHTMQSERSRSRGRA